CICPSTTLSRSEWPRPPAITTATVGSAARFALTTPPVTARTQREEASAKPSTISSAKSSGLLNSRVITHSTSSETSPVSYRIHCLRYSLLRRQGRSAVPPEPPLLIGVS